MISDKDFPDTPPIPPSLRLRAGEASHDGQVGNVLSSLEIVSKLLQVQETVAPGSDVQFVHRQFKAGEQVTAVGQAFDNLHVVAGGFLKTAIPDELGAEQVLAFPMKGDLVGADAIHGGTHTTWTVALSDCDLVELPFAKLVCLGRDHPGFAHGLFGVISREYLRRRGMISARGFLKTEARLARFLVTLAARYGAMGYSDKVFNLQMSRQEIGSYLGIKQETLSRIFSAFDEMGLITVDQRCITIHDAATLKILRGLQPSVHTRKPARDSRSAGGADEPIVRIAV
ncbi:Crp/Fnr family transcriptional regulator [Massilia cavernae]|uniref:Crp/Fnr family transcriptional regulator n=1 Tax=Massilia cavernae TaxID=2320864 RepID=A0A418XAV6_9BURK|nr:Crp/Fnr family transcriptional regulator [Massilia cavernae]RJG09591.1 Crp/Fnr family transcriptional regulator [Massilia cavernae]